MFEILKYHMPFWDLLGISLKVKWNCIGMNYKPIGLPIGAIVATGDIKGRRALCEPFRAGRMVGVGAETLIAGPTIRVCGRRAVQRGTRAITLPGNDGAEIKRGRS